MTYNMSTLSDYHAKCVAKREELKKKQPDINEIIEGLNNSDIKKIKQDPISYLMEVKNEINNTITVRNNEIIVTNKEQFQKSINNLRFFIFASNILFT